MEVCPAMPRAGDDVTERVNPSTLPVAGRPDGTALVTGVDPWVVVEAVLPELEHPATTGRERASRATATGVDRRRSIGPAYCPPHLPLRHLSWWIVPETDDPPAQMPQGEVRRTV